MMKRDQPKLSSIFTMREGQRPIWIPCRALIVVAELFAFSTVIIPHSAGADDIPVPSIADGAAASQAAGPDEMQTAPVANPASGATTAPEDISQLMPLLITAPDHMKLAASLKVLAEEGNLKEAERQLRAAAEVGTLAIIFVEWLDDPGFFPALRELKIPAEHHPETSSSSPHDEVSRSESSMQDLAASQTAALQADLEQQRARAEASARDLAAATEELTALKALRERETTLAADQTSALQTALEQQRVHADAVAQQLASVTEDYRNLRAQRDLDSSSTVATIAGLKEALEQEKGRGDAVARQLTAVLEEVRALRGIGEAGLTPVILRLERLGVRGPIQPDDESRLALSQVITTGAVADAADHEPLEQASAAAQAVPQFAAVQSSVPESRTPAAPVVPSTEDRLVMRGDVLFRQGDVSGARLLLQRAYEAGDPRATFILAETFDPHVLSERGVIGIRSDAAKARELYSRALTLGVEQASARLEALK